MVEALAGAGPDIQITRIQLKADARQLGRLGAQGRDRTEHARTDESAQKGVPLHAVKSGSCAEVNHNEGVVVIEPPRGETAQEPVRTYFLGAGIQVFQRQGDVLGHEQGRTAEKAFAGLAQQPGQGWNHGGQHPGLHPVFGRALAGADFCHPQSQGIGRLLAGGRQGIDPAQPLMVCQADFEVRVAHVKEQDGPGHRELCAAPHGQGFNGLA